MPVQSPDYRFPESPADHRVAVLGASPKPARYSNQALRLLKDYGYRVVPVHPKFEQIEGLPVVASLGAIEDEVQTLSLYVGPERTALIEQEILDLGARRVIFNPGTESPELERRLEQRGIEVIRGCTLVMLRTGQF